MGWFDSGAKAAREQLAWQMQQVADAEAKEAQRQQRLQAGVKAVNELFEGKKVTATRPGKASFSGVTDQGGSFGGVPTGFNVAKKGGQGQGQNQFQYGGHDSMTSLPFGAGGGGGGGYNPGLEAWQQPGYGGAPVAAATPSESFTVTDANGNVVGEFDSLDALKGFQGDTTETYETGETEGGFGQKFYDDYKEKYKNLYTPEIAEQYKDAQDSYLYQHADAGTLASTMYNENLTDVAKQNEKNIEQLGIKADTAATNLKTGIDAQKNALIDAVYSTENPELAANLATNSVKTLTDAQPEYSALGDIFKVLTVGGGNFASSYYDPYRRLGTPGRSGGSGYEVR